jgi:hypothetical protein
MGNNGDFISYYVDNTMKCRGKYNDNNGIVYVKQIPECPHGNKVAKNHAPATKSSWSIK